MQCLTLQIQIVNQEATVVDVHPKLQNRVILNYGSQVLLVIPEPVSHDLLDLGGFGSCAPDEVDQLEEGKAVHAIFTYNGPVKDRNA